jgi:hypothetical protein
MHLIQWHALYCHLVDDLALLGLSAAGRVLLKPMYGLESHGTDVGSACITHAPALALAQACDRLRRQLAAHHQGPCTRGERPATYRTPQLFNMLVLACPGAMDHVAGTGLIEQPASWV